MTWQAGTQARASFVQVFTAVKGKLTCFSKEQASMIDAWLLSAVRTTSCRWVAAFMVDGNLWPVWTGHTQQTVHG